MERDNILKPSQEVQNRAVAHVISLKNLYRGLCQKRKQELVTLYQDVMSYTGDKKADWSSVLKVNFLNQIETLVTARLVRKSPKFIVSIRESADEITQKYFKPTAIDPKEREHQEEAFRLEVSKWANAVQDYLTTTFEEYDLKNAFRNIAKGLVRYGNTYACVNFKRKKYTKIRKGKKEEKTYKEFCDIEYVPFSELFFDPRYKKTEESPAVIWEHSNVRLSELYLFKDELINLDKVKYAGTDSIINSDKQQIYQILIPQATVGNSWEQCDTLTLDKFYGYFSLTGEAEDESIYEIWTLNQSLVLKIKEIPNIPIRSATNFEDPEQHFGIGYLEPVKALQDEYNFKINSSIEYINTSLNRTFLWDPNSGVDPKQLRQASAPGALIVANNGVDAALGGFRELPLRQIPSEFFASSNQIRRDMQSLSFTIDTTESASQQGFTNTATAVRARFYEANTVYADTLEQLESLLTRLSYDMLEQIAENSENDIVVQRLGEERFKFLKKEIFEDAPLRYAIRVEVGSSSFDSIESRREDALAFWTILREAKEAGIDINNQKAFEDILATFERRDVSRYINQKFPSLEEIMSKSVTPQALTNKEKQVIQNAPIAGLENIDEFTKQTIGGGGLI